MKIAYICCD